MTAYVLGPVGSSVLLSSILISLSQNWLLLVVWSVSGPVWLFCSVFGAYEV